ncbi:hypothetical protein KC19_VG095900 [Ceratodon purpureus]|uniref:Uncharacterized protein n=1 Tax=Ceratodon purpureus TaxID=3225 RepID=A0A8T0HNS0_CERPU|nr:hypothetical protein KC19_VG095900 [Ceratodon purpureus]
MCDILIKGERHGGCQQRNPKPNRPEHVLVPKSRTQNGTIPSETTIVASEEPTEASQSVSYRSSCLSYGVRGIPFQRTMGDRRISYPRLGGHGGRYIL